MKNDFVAGKLRPFRWWCYKVLPLVYDDSLSYYELLCKVVAYLNECIKDVGTVEEYLNDLIEQFDELKDYVDNYFNNLDLTEEIDNKIDSLVEEGLFDEILNKFAPLYRNLANFTPNGDALTGDNFGQSLLNAVRNNVRKLYVPKGDYYNPKVVIEGTDAKYDVDVKCDVDAKFYLTEAVNDHVFKILGYGVFTSTVIYNSSFKWSGGEFICQDSEPDNVLMDLSGFGNAWFYLAKRRNVVFEGVKVNKNKLGKFLRFNACEDVCVERCDFQNILSSAIYIENECKGVTVDSCYFKNSVKPVNRTTGDLYDFCYFVYTGVDKNTQVVDSNFPMPCEDIAYRNNYCENSQDCALDTHGARNVVIENNTIINTVNAITAYNDNNRQRRPDGWKMTNVLIQNNYCKSNLAIPSGVTYPHAYVFVGAENVYAPFSPGRISGYYGSPDDFSNCTIKNNYFDTVSRGQGATNSREIIHADTSKNLTIEDNTFVCNGVCSPFVPLKAMNFKFNNNTVIGAHQEGNVAKGSYGEAKNNTGFDIIVNNAFLSAVEGDGKTTIDSTLLFRGLRFEQWGEVAKLYFGPQIGANPNKTGENILANNPTYNVSVADGIMTILGINPLGNSPYSYSDVRKWFLPEKIGMVYVDGSTSERTSFYIKNYVNNYQFEIVDARGITITSLSGIGSITFRDLWQRTLTE